MFNVMRFLLAHLGLNFSEVIHITLPCTNWRGGEFCIKGNGAPPSTI